MICKKYSNMIIIWKYKNGFQPADLTKDPIESESLFLILKYTLLFLGWVKMNVAKEKR